MIGLKAVPRSRSSQCPHDVAIGVAGRVCASLARVAEWQTRWLQVPVFERTWGFKSPLAHCVMSRDIEDSVNPQVGLGLSCLVLRGLPVGW